MVGIMNMFAMLFDWMPHQIEQLCIAVLVIFFSQIIFKIVYHIIEFLPFFR